MHHDLRCGVEALGMPFPALASRSVGLLQLCIDAAKPSATAPHQRRLRVPKARSRSKDAAPCPCRMSAYQRNMTAHFSSWRLRQRRPAHAHSRNTALVTRRSINRACAIAAIRVVLESRGVAHRNGDVGRFIAAPRVWGFNKTPASLTRFSGSSSDTSRSLRPTHAPGCSARPERVPTSALPCPAAHVTRVCGATSGCWPL